MIADTGRKSIAEVRRIVAVMRGEDESPAFGPAPSLSQAPELVAAGGERITLTVTGEPQVLPESLSLAAFLLQLSALLLPQGLFIGNILLGIERIMHCCLIV